MKVIECHQGQSLVRWFCTCCCCGIGDKLRFRLIFVGVLSGIACTSCKDNNLFEKLPSSYTGVAFENRLSESDSLNILDFEYMYNGGGVGVGDFNNDGLQDIFFTANQSSCRLYINKGDFKFDDVTAKSGVKTPYWNTGVSLVDINQDGLIDIYLCTGNSDIQKSSPNQLFLNNGLDAEGNPYFSEVAQKVGLADRGYSTQAAFFDYDNDGDLDCYVLTNALENYSRSLPRGQKNDGTGKSTDRLYRNEGIGSGGLPIFTNVSAQAGITTEGWGLGIAIEDFNEDGWPDIYCANDFQSNDLLWVNNGDGTFTNKISRFIKHQAANSMGMDVADINNDGLPEIVTLDMMPEDNLRQKTMFSAPDYDFYKLQQERQYQPQFVRNMLQFNRGMDADGDPVFSEIGYMSNIYATDWSWSALLGDFDNDGFKDLFITNGYPKDVSNLDFTSYTAQSVVSLSNADREARKKKMKKMEELLGVKKANYCFQNKGDLSFEDVTDKWGMNIPSYSNGAAYADFDNDGDLDIVVNNINDEAFIFRNNLRSDGSGKNSKYLRVKLQGNVGNRNGLGAKVSVFYASGKQSLRMSPYRGYQSTVEDVLHFGLGTATAIDSVIIEWPNRIVQAVKNVGVDQLLVLNQANALPRDQSKDTVSRIFTEASVQHGLLYSHEEEDFNDFNSSFLLPHRFSQFGPSVAAGDLNGDKLDDIFIGGSARNPATVFFQNPDETFDCERFLPKVSEDMGTLIFDVDNDGHNDIYCVSGSSEFGKNSSRYQDRLYRNKRSGKFQLDSTALPEIESSGSCVSACDFDRDGDLDLFVGGRVLPGQYPLPPRSYVLENNGYGAFTDATAKVAPRLARIGMVTAALWTDFDNDSYTDLIVVGEFMPVSFFRNDHGILREWNAGSWIENSVGWWNSLAAGDFDNDGDVDYVAGNLGLNSLYKASPAEPVCIYVKDYNHDGVVDPVLCRYIQGKEYPAHYRESIVQQLPELKKVLFNYKAYGNRTFSDLFAPETIKDSYIIKANQFASLYIQNNGKGKFSVKPMPLEAQLSPLFGMVAADVDNDGNLDLLTVGNDYSVETLTGRYDASVGNYFRGDGKGNFTAVSLSMSGFLVRGDAKALAAVRLKSGKFLFLASQNQDTLKAFGVSSFLPKSIGIFNDDAFAELYFKDGRLRRQEFYYGDGYLSQSSRTCVVPETVVKIIITNTQGKKRLVDIQAHQITNNAGSILKRPVKRRLRA